MSPYKSPYKSGRLSADEVTDLGTSEIVDDSVLAIVTTYDNLGRVQTVTSYDGPTARQTSDIVNQVFDEYDGWGNLTAEWQSHAPGVEVDTNSPATVQYEYDDGAGTGGVARFLRLADTIYPNGQDVQYQYGDPQTDAIDYIMSRLISISDSESGVTDASYKYLGQNQIVAETYDQAGVSLNYDPQADNSFVALDRFGRVRFQIWAEGSSIFDEISYWRTGSAGRAGNITARAEGGSGLGPSDTYSYDSADRLTGWQQYLGNNQIGSRTWTLDALGNDRSSTGGVYNLTNEETPNAGSSVYDAAGNMTTLQSGDTAVYDAWNRLVKVTRASENGDETISTYAYDGVNRRIRESVETISQEPPMGLQTVEDDYYAGQQVVETRGIANEVQHQYIWSPRYIDAPILRDTYSGGVIQPASRIFYLGDANYNVTAIVGKVNGNWQVVERYSYDPYGKLTVWTPNWSSTRTGSQYGNTILYTGREYSFATGLYYNRARYYDPGLERFINRDPIAADINLYAYCDDNPLDATDPLGLDSWHDYSVRLGKQFTQITWGDFHGRPPRNSPYDAEIYRTDYKLRLGKPTTDCVQVSQESGFASMCKGKCPWSCTAQYEDAKVTVDIDRRKSWSKKKGRGSEELLAHEQLHLYIWQNTAQSATWGIQNYVGEGFECSKSAALAEAIADAKQNANNQLAWAERVGDAANNRYDSEANHGLNKGKQAYWNEEWWWEGLE